MITLLSLVLGLIAVSPARANFGYTDNGTAYVVDTGAGLVFQVNKTDGNITSIMFNGVDYNGPSGKGSEIASGLGTPTTVTATSDNSTYVIITLETAADNSVVSDLTQYLVVKKDVNTIYLATYPTAEPTVGELRWITRLAFNLLPNGPAPSDNNGTTGAIESTDVFGHADGTTTSKYYGDDLTHGKDRAMDLTYCGATGTDVGVWMVFGNRESDAGGPFFRDIENQGDGANSDQEIYNYMNSGHNQTEAYRMNVLYGPYALVFTTGAPPTLPIDFSWMGSLGLKGWVPASGRGAVSGTATGIPSGFQGVVGFANSTAQYWAVVQSDGSYSSSGMKPGTYDVTLYKGELAVATSTVTVTAEATTSLDLASAEPRPSVIFRIGQWDGTPAGLLNAANIVKMHPSDVRNANWGPVTYTVGVDDPGAFPAIQMRGDNSPTTINFNLASNQITDLTLRIGITCAYNGGRPQITVNNGWTSPIPSPSSQPKSRSFTIGTYRGNNALFTYTIPASALVVGMNTMTITPVSGSTDLSPWLSAGWVYDAVELDGPIAAPVITYIGGSPLVIQGTAAPFDTVELAVDGSTAAGTATVGADGTWAITYSGPALPAGSHNFTATASDDNGHTGPASAPYSFDATSTIVTLPLQVTTLAGQAGVTGADDGAGTDARFNGPTDVAVDQAGNLYVADTNNQTIRRISPTGVVTTLGGKAGVAGSADGPGTAARFDDPSGLAVDLDGNLYVADTDNDTIRKITPADVVSTLAGAAGIAGNADGTGTAARFNGPSGIAVDSSGEVYVADTLNHVIRKITPTGSVSTLAGLAGSSGSADGSGSAARFFGPQGLALDGQGNLYVADTNNCLLRRIDLSTATVTTVAGQNDTPGDADGPALSAQFRYPSGVCMDSSGDLLVADTDNDTIRELTSAGLVATVAGTAGYAGSVDGTGSNARLDHPTGIAVGPSDAVYVADTDNNTIRQGTFAAAPVIVTQPQSQTVTAGASVQFSVVASGNPTPTYQWYFNGAEITGETTASLTLNTVQASDAGDYTVAVTNLYGSVTSNAATLTVNTPGPGSTGAGGGGGGGGVIEGWFVLGLLVLVSVRRAADRGGAGR